MHDAEVRQLLMSAPGEVVYPTFRVDSETLSLGYEYSVAPEGDLYRQHLYQLVVHFTCQTARETV
jgi:hypothetical protein